MEGKITMLDITDKQGNVVAVLLDDGTYIKKEHSTDDIDELVRKYIKEHRKEMLSAERA